MKNGRKPLLSIETDSESDTPAEGGYKPALSISTDSESDTPLTRTAPFSSSDDSESEDIPFLETELTYTYPDLPQKEVLQAELKSQVESVKKEIEKRTLEGEWYKLYPVATLPKGIDIKPYIVYLELAPDNTNALKYTVRNKDNKVITDVITFDATSENGLAEPHFSAFMTLTAPPILLNRPANKAPSSLTKENKLALLTLITRRGHTLPAAKATAEQIENQVEWLERSSKKHHHITLIFSQKNIVFPPDFGSPIPEHIKHSPAYQIVAKHFVELQKNWLEANVQTVTLSIRQPSPNTVEVRIITKGNQFKPSFIAPEQENKEISYRKFVLHSYTLHLITQEKVPTLSQIPATTMNIPTLIKIPGQPPTFYIYGEQDGTLKLTQLPKQNPLCLAVDFTQDKIEVSPKNKYKDLYELIDKQEGHLERSKYTDTRRKGGDPKQSYSGAGLGLATIFHALENEKGDLLIKNIAHGTETVFVSPIAPAVQYQQSAAHFVSCSSPSFFGENKNSQAGDFTSSEQGPQKRFKKK